MATNHVNDLIPEYVLGLLAEDDLFQVARHLPDCPECRRELHAYEEAVSGLAFSAPLRTPPADLQQRILLQVDRSAQKEEVSQSKRLQPGIFTTLRQFFTRPAGALLGGLALVVVLILGAVNLALWQQFRQQQTQLTSENLRIVHLAGSEESPQASGFLLINPNESSAVLVVENVPALDPSQQYQLWLIRDGKRTNGGI
ncbi:hypothetical protein FDZ74_06630, partial [bacterium]